MTPRRKRRLYLVGLLLLGLGIATALGLTAFQKNIQFFHDPTQVRAGEVPVGVPFRLGGLVREGSVERTEGSLDVRFVLEDCENGVTVQYDSILPDLFREGQGIVTLGRLNDSGVFIADEVFAKHDENYMPPELAESLEKSGGCMPSRMTERK